MGDNGATTFQPKTIVENILNSQSHFGVANPASQVKKKVAVNKKYPQLKLAITNVCLEFESDLRYLNILAQIDPKLNEANPSSKHSNRHYFEIV